MEYKFTNSVMMLLIGAVILLGGMYAYKSYTSYTGTQNVAEVYNGNTSYNTLGSTNTNNIQVSPESTASPSDITIPSPSGGSTLQNPSATTTPTTYNGHYYKQLDTYSKVIYETIASNIDNIKMGKCTMNIDYNFNSLLNQSNGQQVLDSCYKDAINAINLDYPELFYLDLSKISLNIENTTNIFGTTYRLYMNTGDNLNFWAEGFNTAAQVEDAINKIESVKNRVCRTASGSTYNKLLSVHDWIIENMSYSSANINRGNVYGALIEGKVVCEGYARTYKYILDELGIENVLVVGKATNSSGVTEEHMWNYIKFANAWYAVDATWDDPIVYGGGTLDNETKHKYFLVGSSTLFKNHTESGTISSSGKVFSFPTLSVNDYK